MKKQSDRRRWPRGPHETPITTKVLSSTSSSIAPGHTFESSTQDISRRGLCLRVNTQVHTGTELELWVISNRHQETLVLAGAVKWSLPVKGDPTLYQIGVEIAPEPSADLAKWQKMVEDLAAKSS